MVKKAREGSDGRFETLECMLNGCKNRNGRTSKSKPNNSHEILGDLLVLVRKSNEINSLKLYISIVPSWKLNFQQIAVSTYGKRAFCLKQCQCSKHLRMSERKMYWIKTSTIKKRAEPHAKSRSTKKDQQKSNGKSSLSSLYNVLVHTHNNHKNDYNTNKNSIIVRPYACGADFQYCTPFPQYTPSAKNEFNVCKLSLKWM